jgi:hypothetical protein
MTDQFDLTKVDKMVVRFAPHPTVERAHTQLTLTYGGAFPGFPVLFTDGTRETAIEDVTSYVLQVIIDDMISPRAVLTEDKTTIRPFINMAGLQVGCSGDVLSRFSGTALIDAMKQAVSRSNKYPVSIELHILTAHIFFMDPSPSYLDWSRFSMNPNDAYDPSTAQPMVAAEESAQAGQAQAEMTALAEALAKNVTTINPETLTTAAATAIATAWAAAGVPNPAGGGTGAPRAPVGPPGPAGHTFNVNALPDDVKLRYERRLEHKVVLGSQVTTQFASGNFYYADGTRRLILADGTLYLIPEGPLDEKNLMRNPVACKNDTYYGIRTWYHTFASHCMDHGFYVHPLWSFRKNHGGVKGFTIGDGVDDDLPRRLEIIVQQMSHPIYRLLQKKDMFPPESHIHSIVSQSYGDGYKALKQIIFGPHPAFRDQPATLIITYPKQGKYTLLEYHSLFLDYLQLRAYISNIDSSLDSSSELDVFITNAKYGAYLNRNTRDERKITSLRHKYTSAQIVETLETLLQAPDSPMVYDLGPPVRAYTPRQPARPTQQRGNRLSTARRGTPTNRIDVSHDNDRDDVPELSTSESDESVAGLLDDFHNIDVPSDAEARRVHSLYAAAVYTLAETPSAASLPKCIVCRGEHRFAQCDVLNNTDFLRSHYIRYCQQLNREAAMRNAAFGRSMMPTDSAQVNAILETDEQQDDHEDDPDDNGELDFQTGRR